MICDDLAPHKRKAQRSKEAEVCRETTQNFSGAHMGCHKRKELPYNQQNPRNLSGGFFDSKDEKSNRSGAGFIKPDSSLNSPCFAPVHEGHFRPMLQQDFHVWSAFHPNVQKARQNQFYAFESCFYPMSSQCYLPDFRLQEFQYFVVIDFEATCDKEKKPFPQEIIEFPSVLVNSMTGQLEDCFQIYVRPTYNQHLSDFCKELTGIQQTQVDKGVVLSEALLMHDKWLEEKGIKHTNFAVVTWTNWDCRVMLESECQFKKIRKPPYFNRWINLKVPFHEMFGAARCNLKEAVQRAGLAWEGRAHCGLDDAKNTARLLAQIMHRGFRFTITDSLMWQSADCTLATQQFLDPQHSVRIKHPSLPFICFRPVQVDPSKESKDQGMFCFCGVKSSKQVAQKPGPKHGSFFFGCGNWTAARGARCSYFKWATS
ncbi:3'-5' exoribonuclease 1-like isoform X1 [Carya illinoinensis]|uniref:GRF-type domain-containing protein n=1 Tax=Carya illinoinensis TaxID=32201 RepID=A0A8T1NJ43_CARIL|nr:3'-5' exoribonuclease 1-like isoform X1 [Carya illinoinensis]XP_042957621.1 3'-5' exoribonuclease 1-like isoform X1 [Carya illinoinensis]XP_042957622.1 3'-5' exoribonuclease 1-like isoform X1 [Carya illinoinensis]KAG6629818.1 hypothetical protein CIPAW_14G111500 [Carya illinoinensis]KAG6629819.1 hypothetical protein CIPAW_14G111500 [Carya illinoinensis]